MALILPVISLLRKGPHPINQKILERDKKLTCRRLVHDVYRSHNVRRTGRRCETRRDPGHGAGFCHCTHHRTCNPPSTRQSIMNQSQDAYVAKPVQS